MVSSGLYCVATIPEWEESTMTSTTTAMTDHGDEMFALVYYAGDEGKELEEDGRVLRVAKTTEPLVAAARELAAMRSGKSGKRDLRFCFSPYVIHPMMVSPEGVWKVDYGAGEFLHLGEERLAAPSRWRLFRTPEGVFWSNCYGRAVPFFIYEYRHPEVDLTGYTGSSLSSPDFSKRNEMTELPKIVPPQGGSGTAPPQGKPSPFISAAECRKASLEARKEHVADEIAAANQEGENSCEIESFVFDAEIKEELEAAGYTVTVHKKAVFGGGEQVTTIVSW
jgi:hypothetical protein